MSAENSVGAITRSQARAAAANSQQSMSAQEDSIRLNWIFFDPSHRAPVRSINIPRQLFHDESEACEELFVVALRKKLGFTVQQAAIELYQPVEPLSIDSARRDGWTATVNFGNDFRSIPPSRSLATALAGKFNDDSLVHLIIRAQREKFTILYRYFDFPEQETRSLKIEGDASRSDLCKVLAAEGLQDPRNPDRDLRDGYIKIWELDRAHRLLASDDAGWRKAVAECGGNLQEIAVAFQRDKIDTLKLRTNNSGEHFLTVVVSSIYQPSGTADQVEAEDELAPLDTFYSHRYERLVNHQRSSSVKTPSAAANSASYRQTQQEEFRIYDGRCAPGQTSPTIAMPPSLYHPVFQNWKFNAFDQNMEVPPSVIASTAELMQKASVLYDSENERKKEVRSPLQNALRSGMNVVVNSDSTVPDGRISIQLTHNGVTRAVPVLINEEKREGAEATTDATTQASFSMIRTWSDKDLEDFRNLACCPTFLLGFSGCHLVISAAVLTDKCIVERLAMLWVGNSTTHSQNQTEDIARALYSLSLAFDELRQWYEGVIAAQRPLYGPNTANHPRFFPHACRYPLRGEDFTGDIVEFEYKRPLQKFSTCVTFLAQTKASHMQESKRIVVKFVQRYCADLHRLLENQNMAPALLYCGQIDESTPYKDWKMVVMDYFDGRPSYQDEAHLTREIRDAVVDAVKAAHQEGFVFGDLRPPNVLINKEGQIRLIDFDWGGKEGQVRYPAHMSAGIWATGIGPMVEITKDHDLRMIEKWFPPA